jgi:hypothetical protein
VAQRNGMRLRRVDGWINATVMERRSAKAKKVIERTVYPDFSRRRPRRGAAWSAAGQWGCA